MKRFCAGSGAITRVNARVEHRFNHFGIRTTGKLTVRKVSIQ